MPKKKTVAKLQKRSRPVRSNRSSTASESRRSNSKQKSPKSASRSKSKCEPLQAAAKEPEDSPQQPLIVATRQEVAIELKRRLGKGSVRTLNDWFKLGCPNQAGAYNVDEIEAWARDNIGCDDEMQEKGERAYWQTVKIREQALKAQSERLLTDGALVETEIVNSLIERLANTLTTMLGQWPDWILSLLPTGLKPSQRATIRKAVAQKVDELGTTTADILEEWSGKV